MSGKTNSLLGKHVLDLLVAQQDVVDWVLALVDGDVFAVEVGWEEDFGVPDEALAGRGVRDKTSRPVRTANVDNGALLL